MRDKCRFRNHLNVTQRVIGTYDLLDPVKMKCTCNMKFDQP